MKAKTEIRVQLALFATANFILGLGVFMYGICSNSEVHREHLGQLFTNPAALFSNEPVHHHEH